MDTTLNKFWKLFQFENRIKDELANVFSITDGFLWRRDLTRMIAIKIPVAKKGHYDYSMKEIAKETIKKMDIQEDMKIAVETAERKIILEPIHRTEPHSLKYVLRKDQEFNEEASLNLKELKRIMLVCEQKWLIEKEEDPKIIFDFQNGKIKMKNREEEFNIPFEKKIEKKEFEVTYSFHLLKDMLYNKYKEHIFFHISKQYTVMEYDKNIYGVLMHCQ